MAFHDVLFPVGISYGSRVSPGWRSSVVTLLSGVEEITSHQTEPRYRFNVAERIKSYDDLAALVKFYNARRGPANSFRFKDWLDYSSKADGTSTPGAADVNIGTGDGSTKLYQLRKSYSDAGGTTYRTITKPVSATTRVSVNSVEQVSPGWSYPWSVSLTSGIVTFTTAPPSSQAVEAGFEFDCEVRFDEDGLDISEDAYESNSLNVPMVEKIAAAPVEEEAYHGGASSVASGVDISISKADGRCIRLSPSAAIDATLPAKAAIQYGGPHFFLTNVSGSNAITLKDADTGSTVATLATSSSCIVLMCKTSAGVREWRVIS